MHFPLLHTPSKPRLFPLQLDACKPSKSSSSTPPASEPTFSSPYSFGAPLCRVRTRTSSVSLPLSPNADAPPTPAMTRSSTSSTSSSDEPQTPLSPYLAGTPLERIRTRTSSTSSLPSPLPPNCSPCPPPPRSSALPTPRRRPSSSRQPLYSDTFCTLTSTTLTIRHILHRTSLTLPLSSIRSSRPFCTPAERYALLHGGPRRRLTGVRTRGVGWTGITWARDLDRFVDQRWTSAVVLHVDGWVGRVGFSVEDQEAWWRAWEVARKGQAAVNNGLGVGAGKG